MTNVIIKANLCFDIRCILNRYRICLLTEKTTFSSSRNNIIGNFHAISRVSKGQFTIRCTNCCQQHGRENQLNGRIHHAEGFCYIGLAKRFRLFLVSSGQEGLLHSRKIITGSQQGIAVKHNDGINNVILAHTHCHTGAIQDSLHLSQQCCALSGMQNTVQICQIQQLRKSIQFQRRIRLQQRCTLRKAQHFDLLAKFLQVLRNRFALRICHLVGNTLDLRVTYLTVPKITNQQSIHLHQCVPSGIAKLDGILICCTLVIGFLCCAVILRLCVFMIRRQIMQRLCQNVGRHQRHNHHKRQNQRQHPFTSLCKHNVFLLIPFPQENNILLWFSHSIALYILTQYAIDFNLIFMVIFHNLPVHNLWKSKNPSQ